MKYDSILAPAAKEMRPSGIRRFFDMAAEMPHCISLGVGEPDFKTPWAVRDAGIRSLEQGRTKYTANAGLMQLRQEICRYLSRRFELDYQPNEVVVTVGGSEAIDLCIRALVQPGDEVIIPEPCFVCYEPITQLTGGVPVHIATKAEEDFRLTADQLKAAITPKTKLLVLPFPNNPTGGVMSATDLEAIAEVLRGTDIMVLSDEIYSELTYGGLTHVSFASLPGMRDYTLTINGFSKSFAMTGWRVGYTCGPAELISVMIKIHQYGILCAPRQGQVAALEALKTGRERDYEDVVRMRESYDRRRRLMVEGFRAMGMDCFEPLGAFYIFPSIAKTGLTSEEFCKRLLEEEGVACVPGTAFGPCGEGHIRCSYATAIDKLNTALDKMAHFLSRLQAG